MNNTASKTPNTASKNPVSIDTKRIPQVSAVLPKTHQLLLPVATEAQILYFANHLKSKNRGIHNFCIGQGFTEKNGITSGDALCELPFAFPELWEFRTLPSRTHLKIPLIVGQTFKLIKVKSLIPNDMGFEYYSDLSARTFFGINQELFNRIFVGIDNYYGPEMQPITPKMIAQALEKLVAAKQEAHSPV